MVTSDIRIPKDHWLLNPRLSGIGSSEQAMEAIALMSGKGGIQKVRESIDYLGAFAGSGMINQFTGDYGLWGTVTGAQGAAGAFFSLYFLLNTVWFNRIQRYTARYLALSNGIASACAFFMSVLALGEGFEYKCKDKGADRVLEDWIEQHNWHQQSKRLFKEFIIQGEVIIRLFGEDFRVIDPDYLYSARETKDGLADRYQGILAYGHDSSLVEAYEIHDTPIYGTPADSELVPARDVQYRADLMFNERRGRSHFLPVFPQMFKVDQLSTVLLDTAQTQGKIAFYRKHEAPIESVQFMEGAVQAQSPPGYSQYYAGPNTWQSQERYPSGAIIDMPSNMSLETLGADNFSQWIEPMNFALRMIATQCALPAEILSQNRGDSDSYAASIVSNSWQEKVIKSFQDDWKTWDLDLLSRCTGIPKRMIDVTAPQIATPDKRAEAEIINGALDRHVMSRRTAQVRMNLDPEEENRYIKQEEKEDLQRQKQQAEIQGKENDGDRAPKEPAKQTGD